MWDTISLIVWNTTEANVIILRRVFFHHQRASQARRGNDLLHTSRPICTFANHRPSRMSVLGGPMGPSMSDVGFQEYGGARVSWKGPKGERRDDGTGAYQGGYDMNKSLI